jgi:hypothetical protein
MLGVVPVRHPRGMFGTHRSAKSQAPHDAKDLDGHVRAVGPIADVLGDGFFTAIGRGGAQGDVWHELM